MNLKTEAKIPKAAAVKQPLVVLEAAALAQVAGGGPNGGWSATPTAAPVAGAAGNPGGPNGGWAATQGGPNGGW